MIVTSESNNSYQFSNISVGITDNTVITDDTVTPIPATPDVNMLIPIVTESGLTNAMTLFYPGEPNRYIKNFGTPNSTKFGFGPDFIHAILSKAAANIGVYTVNLRGATATHANVIVRMKYKVVADVPYTNDAGEPYYKDAVTGKLTPLAGTSNTPVVRDVLHVCYDTTSIPNVKSWVDLHDAMNTMAGTTDGDYTVQPWFAIMYRGASTYGNNVYMKLTGSAADFDGLMYYTISAYDGSAKVATDGNISFDTSSGEKYSTTYYIENKFNDMFPTMRFLTAEADVEIIDLISKYMYSVDELLAGDISNPTLTFNAVDAFSHAGFAYVVDSASINIGADKALVLANGNSGTETRDQLFADFFAGSITGVEDVNNVLRYRITNIPDIGYDDATISNIKDLLVKRNRMTTTCIMVGGTDTFTSAILEHQSKHYDSLPGMRQISRVQSPMMYNRFLKKTIRYPAQYFDTVAWVNFVATNGNYFMPFAGASARWTGYIEDTMKYPVESTSNLQSLTTARINVLMKDNLTGGYLSDQLMNTQYTSDQTEFNNEILITCMLYDLIHLIHENHFRFNEAAEVTSLKSKVSEDINTKYAKYSANLDVDVYRAGTTGLAKSTNMVKVTVNMLDINKYTDVELILTND